MNSLIAIQGWLYNGMASGLGEVAGGDMRAVLVAMAAAVLFGAVHAMMPGHGKTVLVSYHLGQPGKLREGIANGAILTLTHVGLALVLVLAGFAVISRAFAQGGRTTRASARADRAGVRVLLHRLTGSPSAASTRLAASYLRRKGA
jgi:nickel/cobalt transporter (NicO) family protein